MRTNDKKQKSIQQMTLPAEEFGLGIQVFKIQSSKVTQEDRNKQRKAIKNIENPVFTKPSVIVAKKPNVLPSLSVQKKVNSFYHEEQIKQRKKTVQKKKIAYIADPIKQNDQKKITQQKKQDFVHQSLKNVQPDQTVLTVKQKEITQIHYRKSFNQLLNFNIKLQEKQIENLKEIKKLRKQKQRDQQAFQQLLRRKQDKKLLVQAVIELQQAYFPYEQDEYDQFDLNKYVNNDFKFKHYDIVETFDY